MFRFLLMFFLLYGGLHGYAFWKIRSAFFPGPVISVLVAAVMALMIVAPALIRISERYGLEWAARILSHAGYAWMGILFLFAAFALAFDLCRLLVFLSGLVWRMEAVPFLLSARFAFFLPLFLALGIFVYGWFDARNIRIESLTIQTDKIPPETGRLRLVQISDIHIGLMNGPGFVSRMVRVIQEAGPDLLLSTGDLVDGQINSIEKVLPLFQELRPRLGKYAVTGNHEFYAGIAQASEFTRKAGFQMLRGEGVTVAGLINIVGIDDPTGRAVEGHRPVEEGELLNTMPVQHFTLLLKHLPLVDKHAVDRFDLQLSGHTHKGQIFPFSLITRWYFPFHSGSFRLSDISRLHVSRGTGTWGPPIRFLSPPEVTVIDLVAAGNPVERVSGRQTGQSSGGRN
jgi:predicted MPP superfamily phosphohydrolase